MQNLLERSADLNDRYGNRAGRQCLLNFGINQQLIEREPMRLHSRPSKRRQLAGAVICAAVALITVTSSAGGSEEARTDGVSASETPVPEPTPAANPGPVQARVPKEHLEPVLNKAAALANVPRDKLVIVQAESVVWSDGSLGCPEPGALYTQALVDGYWIVIAAEGKTYDFRMALNGVFQLCPEGRGGRPASKAEAF